MIEILWKINLATSFFMTGLIWLIQIVHYPLFANVGNDEFIKYHYLHSYKITFIVLPVMLLELVAFIALCIEQPIFIFEDKFLLGFLIFIIWSTTAFLSVPTHQKLQMGFNYKAYKYLVKSNWLRTIAWSLKSIYLLGIVKL